MKKDRKPWIVAIDWILVAGIIINFVAELFWVTKMFDWRGIFVAMGVLYVIISIRDKKMEKAKIIDYGERPWITAMGWMVALGFVVNCFFAPYFETVDTINWIALVTAMIAVLVIDTAKDIRLATSKDSEE